MLLGLMTERIEKEALKTHQRHFDGDIQRAIMEIEKTGRGQRE